MERTAPEFWFHRCLRVVRELDIDDFILMWSGCLSRLISSVRLIVLIENMLRDWVCYIEAVALGPRVVLKVSRLADMNGPLLFILIRQSQRGVVEVIVDDHVVIVFHFFIVSNRGSCRGHRRVPGYIRVSWEGSSSHLIIVVRSGSWKNVHPCVVTERHSW